MSSFMDLMRDPRFSFTGGQPMTGLNESGYAKIRMEQSERFLEAARLVNRVYQGDKWARHVLSEALTTSDFPGYFGQVINRQVLSNYAETPYTWSQYCKRGTTNDLRQALRFRFDRGAAVLDGPIISTGSTTSTPGTQSGGSGATGIEQVSEYPERRRTSASYALQLYKYGARMPFAWETMLNDDLDALKDTPALFGRAARRTEEKKVTELFVSSTGPNATFFSAANKNILTAAVLTNLNSQYGLSDNPHFSITALQAAMNLMANQVDLDGEPISIDAWCLVYPPALEIPVKNVLSTTQVWYNDAGGTIGSNGSLERLLADNWAKNVVQPAKNYYLPQVNTTSGNKAWYLFASPSNGRPALEMDFLRGHESPELFMKLPNQVAIGEGSMGPGSGSMAGTSNTNPMEGDFDTDAIHYKVRHVMGGTTLDPIMAVASAGTDS